MAYAMDFTNLSLNEDLRATVAELGYTQMTPIQALAIPLMLEGRDVIAQSQTGSGKTAAFALPMLQKIDLTLNSIQALILCPTRELAQQVAGEIRKLGRRHRDLRLLLLVGGTPGRAQAEALEAGVHIAVGTPGRVVDHLQRQRLNLEHLRLLVLDEADRMLEMGFQDEMNSILQQLPEPRQTAFFSATYPEFIASLSRRFQHKPERLVIEEEAQAAPDIEHLIFEVEDEPKSAVLLRALQEYLPKSALVFANQKNTVDEIVEGLHKVGVSSEALHGDLEQRDRDRVLAKFRNRSTRVLVATDVAARGLDIADLDLVVNYDLPHQTDTYIHRVGRTGRAGKSGRALALVLGKERLHLTGLQEAAGTRFATAKLGFKNQRGLPPDSPLRESAMQTLVIAGGRKDKIRAGDILGALTGVVGGLTASQVGKIEVHETFTYVAVEARVAADTAKRLHAGKIKNRKFLTKLLI